MISIYSISALIMAYLLGSIPSAVWIGQAFYHVDVREYGSGNAGATNTFRVLGKKAGIPVMLIDILKGWTATNLAYFIGVATTGAVHSNAFVNYQLALGITAVMGHLFPIFAGFRGGKGVATLFGMVLAVSLASIFAVRSDIYYGAVNYQICIAQLHYGEFYLFNRCYIYISAVY